MSISRAWPKILLTSGLRKSAANLTAAVIRNRSTETRIRISIVATIITIPHPVVTRTAAITKTAKKIWIISRSESLALKKKGTLLQSPIRALVVNRPHQPKVKMDSQGLPKLHHHYIAPQVITMCWLNRTG